MATEKLFSLINTQTRDQIDFLSPVVYDSKPIFIRDQGVASAHQTTLTEHRDNMFSRKVYILEDIGRETPESLIVTNTRESNTGVRFGIQTFQDAEAVYPELIISFVHKEAENTGGEPLWGSSSPHSPFQEKRFSLSDSFSYLSGCATSDLQQAFALQDVQISFMHPYCVQFQSDTKSCLIHYVDDSGNWQTVEKPIEKDYLIEQATIHANAIITTQEENMFQLAQKISGSDYQEKPSEPQAPKTDFLREPVFIRNKGIVSKMETTLSDGTIHVLENMFHLRETVHASSAQEELFQHDELLIHTDEENRDALYISLYRIDEMDNQSPAHVYIDEYIYAVDPTGSFAFYQGKEASEPLWRPRMDGEGEFIKGKSSFPFDNTRGYLFGVVSDRIRELCEEYHIPTASMIPYLLETDQDGNLHTLHYVNSNGRWDSIPLMDHNKELIPSLLPEIKAIITPNENIVTQLAETISRTYIKINHTPRSIQTASQLAERVSFEHKGTKEKPHGENHGVLLWEKKKNEMAFMNHVTKTSENPPQSIAGVVTAFSERKRLAELNQNQIFAKLATRWGIDATVDYQKLVWACYGTSGTEMNAKEQSQIYSLAKMIQLALNEEKSEKETGMIYFIDNSHPMRQQFKDEAKMYASQAELDEEQVEQAYFNLFAGKVNRSYIKPFLLALKEKGASKKELEQVGNNWQQRADLLEVCADAIQLPDLDDYLSFYELVGMHASVKETLKEAYRIIEERNFPKTITSLRCIHFSLLCKMLHDNLNISIPLITVPAGEIAKELNMEQLSLKEWKSFVSEFAGGSKRGNRAYFNTLDPYGMGEIAIETHTPKQESQRYIYKRKGKLTHVHPEGYVFLHNQLVKKKQQKKEIASNGNSVDRTQEIIEKKRRKYKKKVENLPYAIASLVSHNSGVGHYALLKAQALAARRLDQDTGSSHPKFAMVIDNYEADDVHEQLFNDTAARVQEETVLYTQLIRGWEHLMDTFFTTAEGENDPDKTLGAAPPLDIKVHLLLSDPHGLQQFSLYSTMISRYAGTNATVALHLGGRKKGTGISFIYNNETFASNMSRTKGKYNVLFVSPERAQRATNETAAAQLANGREVAILNKWQILNAQRTRVLAEWKKTADTFNEQHQQDLETYFQNKIRAIAEVVQISQTDEQWQYPLPDFNYLYQAIAGNEEQIPPSALLADNQTPSGYEYYKTAAAAQHEQYLAYIEKTVPEERLTLAENSEFSHPYRASKEAAQTIQKYYLLQREAKAWKEILGNEKYPTIIRMAQNYHTDNLKIKTEHWSQRVKHDIHQDSEIGKLYNDLCTTRINQRKQSRKVETLTSKEIADIQQQVEIEITNRLESTGQAFILLELSKQSITGTPEDIMRTVRIQSDITSQNIEHETQHLHSNYGLSIKNKIIDNTELQKFQGKVVENNRLLLAFATLEKIPDHIFEVGFLIPRTDIARINETLTNLTIIYISEHRDQFSLKDMELTQPDICKEAFYRYVKDISSPKVQYRQMFNEAVSELWNKINRDSNLTDFLPALEKNQEATAAYIGKRNAIDKELDPLRKPHEDILARGEELLTRSVLSIAHEK